MRQKSYKNKPMMHYSIQKAVGAIEMFGATHVQSIPYNRYKVKFFRCKIPCKLFQEF